MTLMYIHGYGSTGQAYKAKLLQEMFPEHRVVSPTLDYDGLSPQSLLSQLRQVVEQESPSLVVGSSMGGYFALCCTSFYSGKVWCINPVRDMIATLYQLAESRPELKTNEQAKSIFERRLAEYCDFEKSVFRSLHPADGQLSFALSTDDELLGDHRPLLELFPNYDKVVWKSNCGHRFMRFSEIKDELQP